MGVNRILNEKLSTTFVLLPKIVSNFGPIANKEFQIGGLALFKYKKSESFNFKCGLYYNSELFGLFFVPILGLYFLSQNKRAECNILLPLQADFNYKIVKFLNLGINFNGQMRSYHLTNISKGINNSYVNRSTNEFFVYFKFNFGKSFVFQTKVGPSVARYYRVYNDKVTFGLPTTFFGPKRSPLNTDFSDGLIYQLVLFYRLDINQ